MDFEALAQQIRITISQEIEAALAPVLARLDELEARSSARVTVNVPPAEVAVVSSTPPTADFEFYSDAKVNIIGGKIVPRIK